MSEPTNAGRQQPDPHPAADHEAAAEENPDEVQDAPSESVVSDPTAPLWASPTTPIPAPPIPPGAAQQQSDQPADQPQGTQPAAPPVSNPYAQQPPPPPYAYQPPPAPHAYQQAQPYGPPQPGPQYPVYGQRSYAPGTPTEANGSAIVLTILSGVSLFACNILAIAPLVLGIVSLTKNATDHEGSRRLTKIGWIVFGVVWVVGILIAIGYVVLLATAISNGSGPNTNFGN